MTLAVQLYVYATPLNAHRMVKSGNLFVQWISHHQMYWVRVASQAAVASQTAVTAAGTPLADVLALQAGAGGGATARAAVAVPEERAAPVLAPIRPAFVLCTSLYDCLCERCTS